MFCLPAQDQFKTREVPFFVEQAQVWCTIAYHKAPNSLQEAFFLFTELPCTKKLERLHTLPCTEGLISSCVFFFSFSFFLFLYLFSRNQCISAIRSLRDIMNHYWAPCRHTGKFHLAQNSSFDWTRLLAIYFFSFSGWDSQIYINSLFTALNNIKLHDTSYECPSSLRPLKTKLTKTN